MIITVPKRYIQHTHYSNGMRVPAGFQLFENSKYSVMVELDKLFPCVSVGLLSGKEAKEQDAAVVIREFGIVNFERILPPHPSRAVYFRILNE